MTRADFKPEAPVRGSVEPAAPLGAMPELFTCEPYQARITKSACATRWTKVNGPSAKTRGTPRNQSDTAFTGAALQFRACVGCEVGARHARSVPALETAREALTKERRRLVVIRAAEIAEAMAAPAPAVAPPPKTTAPTPAPKETTMPNPLEITFRGRTQSASAWARELGCSEPTIRNRHKKGVSLDAPLQGDPGGARGGRRENTSGRKAPAPPPTKTERPPTAITKADGRGNAGISAADAARILEALGFHVVALDPAAFGPDRYVFSARQA